MTGNSEGGDEEEEACTRVVDTIVARTEHDASHEYGMLAMEEPRGYPDAVGP